MFDVLKELSLRMKLLIGVGIVAILAFQLVVAYAIFQSKAEDQQYDPIRIDQFVDSSPSASPSVDESFQDPDAPMSDYTETDPKPVDTNCWGCGPQ